MRFETSAGLSDLDIKCLDHAQELGATVEIVCEESHSVGIDKVKFIGNGFGDYFFFCGHLLRPALIQAFSFSDAYDEYIDECVTCDEPDSEEEAELGHYTGSGKWISEVEMSYIGSGIAGFKTLKFNITGGE